MLKCGKTVVGLLPEHAGVGLFWPPAVRLIADELRDVDYFR